MCGIAGIVRLDGSSVDPVSLDALTDALRHRGPDGRGVFLDGNVGLGHRRLSILDLTTAAAQPMISADRSSVLTFNGEIYNYQELKRELELRGHTFRSTGDSEVLLRLYEEYGEECLQKLRGMFAFAILDRRRQTLFVARDRLGKKPLKYFLSGSTFAFASELKALRTLKECPRSMHGESVHHALTMMYVLAPQTGIDGIKKLPAAHFLRLNLKTGSIEIQRYWSLSYESQMSRTRAEWEEEIMRIFHESVRLRMRSDVPVGAFLSGGVDSSAVVMVMSQLSPKPVETFSIGTRQETHNELPLAEEVARRFQTNHHPILVEPDIVHLLPELVSIYEEPYADSSAIPTTLIAREARKVVTVALNGDGGDEHFAGYVRYPILKFSRFWKLLLPLHPLANGMLRMTRYMRDDTLVYRARRFSDAAIRPLAERHLHYLSFFTEPEKRSLYRDGFGDAYPDTYRFYAERTKALRAGVDWVSGALRSDLETYLADDLLPKVDLGSMASGLEARSPLLDHELFELTASIPSHFKLHGFSTKWIFKHMLRDHLPHRILDRQKTGFRLPLDAWFRSSLRPFVLDRLLSPSAPLHRIFDRGLLEAYLAEYFHSNIDLSDHVWSLLWLDEWMRQYT